MHDPAAVSLYEAFFMFISKIEVECFSSLLILDEKKLVPVSPVSTRFTSRLIYWTVYGLTKFVTPNSPVELNFFCESNRRDYTSEEAMFRGPSGIELSRFTEARGSFGKGDLPGTFSKGELMSRFVMSSMVSSFVWQLRR